MKQRGRMVYYHAEPDVRLHDLVLFILFAHKQHKNSPDYMNSTQAVVQSLGISL